MYLRNFKNSKHSLPQNLLEINQYIFQRSIDFSHINFVKIIMCTFLKKNITIKLCKLKGTVQLEIEKVLFNFLREFSFCNKLFLS